MSDHNDQPPPHDAASDPATLDWVNQIADRFEADWKKVRDGGSPPRLADYVAEADDPRGEALLCELIGLDIDYRRLRGETPQPEVYIVRFPSLDRAWLNSELAARSVPIHRDQAVQPQALRIRCPHCQVVIEVVDIAPESDITCPSCGSQISSAERNQNASPIPQPASHEQETILQSPESQAASASASAPSTAPQRPPVIEAFGRFQLLKRLGGGAYGEVFWAYDPQLDRDVAIKRPHQRRLPAELAERFAREARAAAQLQHRHIVGTYEVGEVDGRPYIASEYILGTDLAARAKAEKDQNRLLPPRDIALLCAQVAEALHVAHEACIET